MLTFQRAAPLGGGLKTVRGPKVTRLAATCLELGIDNQFATHEACFDHTGSDGEWLIEFAGRECYQSFHNPAGRTTAEYVRNIIKQGHYSVLEHVNVSYRVEGVSRSLTHELIRHRHFSYSQLSQRYVDSREAWFVCPPLFLSDYELFKEWERITLRQQQDLVALEELVRARHPALSQKKIREAVRSVAPNSIETKVVLTGNLRTFREFLPKRMSSHAEAEIQRLANAIHKDLNKLFPSVFDDVAGD